MQFYDICTKKTFTKKDGSTKTFWLKCGTMRELEDGKRFLELNMFPDTSFYVFAQKKKEEEQDPFIE